MAMKAQRHDAGSYTFSASPYSLNTVSLQFRGEMQKNKGLKIA